jgi:hypothetical protein
MLLRVHTVPLDARDGNEVEPDDDHFSIVSGLWLGMWFTLLRHSTRDWVCDLGVSLSGSWACFHFSFPTRPRSSWVLQIPLSLDCRPIGEC